MAIAHKTKIRFDKSKYINSERLIQVGISIKSNPKVKKTIGWWLWFSAVVFDFDT